MRARDLLAAASPRPWFVVGLPWNQGEPWINAETEDPHGGRYVCEFDSDSIADMDQHNLDADAALIVTAVNEYEPLLDIEHEVRQIWKDDAYPLRIARALGRLEALRSGSGSS